MNIPEIEEIAWYAVYVKSRHEFKVAETLTKKGIVNTLPTLKKMKQWSDRKKVVIEPLFRGYVFVNINLKQDKYNTLHSDGVVKFIGIKNEPSAVPEKQMLWMKIITDNSEKVKLNSPIPVGKKVKVTYGPFKGLEGTVIHEKNASRLTVLFDSIAQAISVEINPEYLKKLK